MEWSRGFQVVSQTVNVTVDFGTQSLVGYTELHINPKIDQLDNIWLHSRQCKINSVFVDDYEAQFELHDYLGTVVDHRVRDLKSYCALYAGDLEASEQGELRVTVPMEVSQELLVDKTIIVRIEYELRKPVGALYFAGINPKNPSSIDPWENGSNNRVYYPHMFTRADVCGGNTIGGGCGARCWFPCVDTVQSRCPMHLSFTVHTELVAVSVGDLVDVVLSKDETSKVYLYEHTEPVAPHNVSLAVGPYEMHIDPSLPWVTHFCLPGKLDALIKTTQGIPKTIHQFENYLGAAFPFKSYKQVYVDDAFAYDNAASYSTMAILSDANLFGDYDESEPYLQCKKLALQARCVAANYFGALVPVVSHSDAWLILGLTGFMELLYIKRCIGDVEASQYLMEFVQRVKRADRRATDVGTSPGSVLARTLIQPQPAQYPVDSALWAAHGIEYDSVISSKALVIMHMLEEKVTPDVFKRVIHGFIVAAVSRFPRESAVFKSVFQSTEPGEPLKLKRVEGSMAPPGDGKRDAAVDNKLELYEVSFMSKLRSTAGVHGQDINALFVTQWLRNSGFPRLLGGIVYHRNKNTIEMALRQEIPPDGRRFQGMIQIKVVEDDGAWVYEKRLENEKHTWTIQCHTQPAKKKKGRKRKGENVEEMWRDPENLSSPEKLLNMVIGQRDRSVRRGRKMAYWVNDTPVRYVLLDPKMCWLRDLQLTCDEFMLLDLLNEKDKAASRDVLNQVFALRQLARRRYPVTQDKEDELAITMVSLRPPGALASCLLNEKKPERVRVEAAFALAEWQNNYAPDTIRGAGPGTSWMGLELMLKCFRELFYQGTGLVPNNFTIAGECVIKPAIAKALAMIRAKNGEPPLQCREILLDLLKNNDNSQNPRSDGIYMGRIIKAATTLVINLHESYADEKNQGDLTSAMRKSARDYNNEVAELIGRYLEYDALAPSPDHAIAASCLKALSRLESAGVISPKTPFYAYAIFTPPGEAFRIGSSFNASLLSSDVVNTARLVASHDWGVVVREAAFKAIIGTYLEGRAVEGAAWMNVFRWVLNAIARDPCPMVRRKVMKVLLKQHADTIHNRIQELDYHESPAGAFWPLVNSTGDMGPGEIQAARGVAEILWLLMNEGTAYDARLRCYAHQLWKCIWKVEQHSLFDDVAIGHAQLGPFTHWIENCEEERGKDASEANAASNPPPQTNGSDQHTSHGETRTHFTMSGGDYGNDQVRKKPVIHFKRH